MNLSLLSGLQRLASGRACILMYHRVGDSACDPWQLAVSVENFEQHLKVLRKQVNVITLSSLINQLLTQSLKRGSVVLTFDDGYFDNYAYAKPLLERYDLPATFFIPTNNLDSKGEYWWDELERIFIQTETLPATLSLNFISNPQLYRLEDEVVASKCLHKKHQEWILDWTKPSASPSLRSNLYSIVWQALKPTKHTEQQAVLKELRKWAGVSELGREEYRCMTVQQVKELARNTLFEVGAHTLTHPALSAHKSEVQTDEINASKSALESIIEKSVHVFSYPHGDYDAETLDIIQVSGFMAAVTTRHRPIQETDGIFELGRFQVCNWDKQEFKQNLNKWTENNYT